MGWNNIITILSSVIIAGLMVTASVTYVVNNDDDNDNDDKGFDLDDGTLDYVSFGASNTNGYGMRGYISEEDIMNILSGAVSKDDVNVYGYQKTPEGAYPDLIRDHYAAIYGEENVVLDQLAISSMRVEELRIMLDETYDGDSYSQWRFTCEDGWFYAAEEGGLEALRATCKEKVTNADLITVDIGWNNFGVYICNQMMDVMKNGTYKWTVDLGDIYDNDEDIDASNQAKEIIRGYIVQNMGDNDMSRAITDVFAYALLGYMYNFDIVMDKIHTMNPDAKVVVIGIQNLLHGVVVEIAGNQFPLGDIYGNFVNMANYYASACSPQRDNYLYVKAGVDEHVNIFLDLIKEYDGDPSTLNHNVLDCFDYYDNSDFLHIQPAIDMFAAEAIREQYGTVLPLLGYDTAEEMVIDGKKGELIDFMDIQETFDAMYWPALNAAYDTLGEFVQTIAALPYVNVDGLLGDTTLDIDGIEDAMGENLLNEIVENATQAMNGQEYTVDIDKLAGDPDTELVANMFIRFYMGNSFFAHPDETGHEQIKTAVVGILTEPSNETVQSLDDDLVDSVNDICELFA